jgi:hypothetical protein
VDADDPRAQLAAAEACAARDAESSCEEVRESTEARRIVEETRARGQVFFAAAQAAVRAVHAAERAAKDRGRLRRLVSAVAHASSDAARADLPEDADN